MITLKCEFCGHEQVVKKHLDKYIRYEVVHCKHIWCPQNKCKEQHPRPLKVGDGLVRHSRGICGWDFVVTEDDATYLQQHLEDGSWSEIMIPTIEDLRMMRRARLLMEYGASLGKKK